MSARFWTAGAAVGLLTAVAAVAPAEPIRVASLEGGQTAPACAQRHAHRHTTRWDRYCTGI